jgi:hypothetical protein
MGYIEVVDLSEYSEEEVEAAPRISSRKKQDRDILM